MIRRILVLGAIACAAVAVSLAAPAGAQAAYTGCTATLSDTTPDPGQVITVSGNTGHAGNTVGAFIGTTLIGSGVTDANGDFSFSATIPSTATGTITVTIDCNVQKDTEVLGIQITVGGGGGLVVTGSNDTLPLTKMAIALITVGGLALAASRRRSAAVARSDSRT
jgi:hypothetical protein